MYVPCTYIDFCINIFKVRRIWPQNIFEIFTKLVITTQQLFRIRNAKNVHKYSIVKRLTRSQFAFVKIMIDVHEKMKKLIEYHQIMLKTRRKLIENGKKSLKSANNLKKMSKKDKNIIKNFRKMVKTMIKIT